MFIISIVIIITKIDKNNMKKSTKQNKIEELELLLSDYEDTYKHAKKAESNIKKIIKHAYNKIKSIEKELEELKIEDSDDSDESCDMEEESRREQKLFRILKRDIEVKLHYDNNRCYFASSSLAHGFASKHSNPPAIVSEIINNYAIINDKSRINIIKYKEKWYITLKAFEKHVLPYIPNATMIEY